MPRRLAPLALSLAVAACGVGPGQPAPERESADEAKALDEAAAMVRAGRPTLPSPAPSASARPPSAPS